jgi:hypothetical protein
MLYAFGFERVVGDLSFVSPGAARVQEGADTIRTGWL